MATAPEFSLLLPVYAGDNPAFLALAFASSVDEQTLPPKEVVIVQDGPVSEALEAELARLKRESPVPVRFVRLSRNQGLTYALNAGLDACRFPVIARMDADDVSVRDRFEKQWELIAKGYDLVGTGMAEFEVDPDVVAAVRTPPTGSKRIRDHARTHNPFNHPTMMYRLAALEAVGKYEPFGKMEDYWLGIRLIAAGALVENIPEPLLKYRVGSGAFSRRGGWQEAKTEWALQRRLLKMGFVSRLEFLRNVIVKGVYRLIPAQLKRVLFRQFVASGLPGDRA